MFFNFKKKRRRTLTRYVYLMERNPSLFRSFLGLFIRVREIKIGIAKSTKQRHADVDQGIPGKVVVIASYTIEQASKTESYLHQLFKEHRFTVKGAKSGSGKTEFFKLTNLEIQKAESILQRRSVKTFSFRKLFVLIVFLLTILFFLIQSQNT